MPDVAAAIIWEGTTFLVLAACWRISGRLFPGDVGCQRLLHTAVLTWGLLVAVAILLGVAGTLTGPLLIGVLATTAFAALAMTRGSNSLPPLVMQQGGLGYWWGWLIVAAFLFGRLVVAGVCQFPTDWDSLNYHLPLIDHWLQTGSLYAPGCRAWYVPGNNEVVGLWMACLFSGDYLIGLMNLPAAMILVLGTLELGRSLRLRPPVTHLAALVILCSGVVLRQLLTAKNDLAATALFITALAYIFRHARDRRAGSAALAAMSLGLLAGIKYYALGYAAVAGGTWVCCGGLRGGIKTGCQNGIWGLLGGLVWGGYWYVRNAFLTGTPLYPKGLTREADVLSNWRGGVWSTTLLGNGSPEVFPLTLEAVWKNVGPGHYVAGLAILGVVAWLLVAGVLSGLKWVDSVGRTTRLALALAIIGTGLVWGMIPFAVETEPGTLNFLRGGYLTARFGLCFLTLAVVGLAVVFSDLWESLGPAEGGRIGYLAKGVRSVVLAMATLGVGWHLFICLKPLFPIAELDIWLVGLNVLLAVYLYTLTLHIWPSWKSLFQVMALVMLTGIFAAGCSGLAQSWHEGFVRFYHAHFNDPTVAKLELSDPASTKLCTIIFQSYPFFGSRRQLQVFSPHWLANEKEFLFYVWEGGATHIVANRRDPSWNQLLERIHQWVVGRPQLFPSLLDENMYIVYRVDREALRRTIESEGGSVPPGE